MASDTNQFDGKADHALLTADDSSPVRVINPEGLSSFLLIGDHAGNLIPARLDTLGLDQADLTRHIAWDIGVGVLGKKLSDRMDAVFVRQSYSRLLIDCNRSSHAADAIPEIADGTKVPANVGMTDSERAARVTEIYCPYHQAIATELDRRDALGLRTTLVALHSFTPVMQSIVRPWHIGILHDAGDPRFALACLDALRGVEGITVGNNEPYSMDGIDYTVPRHAYPKRRPYVEIELRQDQLSDRFHLDWWVTKLVAVLEEADASI